MHNLFVVSEIVHVHHVIVIEIVSVIDMVLHEMNVHLVVIIVEVDEEEEEVVVMVVVIILDVVVEVAITILNVNHINHVLDLIITNHHGKIVEEEDVGVVEEVFMIVNEIWAAISDLMNSYHQVISQLNIQRFFFLFHTLF